MLRLGETRFRHCQGVGRREFLRVGGTALAGLSLDFPAPLGKSQSDTMPLRFGLSPVVSSDSTVQQEEIRINLGRSMSGRVRRSRKRPAIVRI